MKVTQKIFNQKHVKNFSKFYEQELCRGGVRNFLRNPTLYDQHPLDFDMQHHGDEDTCADQQMKLWNDGETTESANA